MDKTKEPEKKDWEQIMNESFYPLKLKDILNPLTYPISQRIVFFLVLFLSIFLILIGNKTVFLSSSGKENLSNMPRTPAVLKTEESFDREALLKKVSSKIIFKVVKKLPPPAVKKFTPKGPTLQDKINGFILLGVMIEDPMQAMVESRATHETFCVKAGDMITDIQVVSVENGKVTLSYNEETGVLR